jgi:chromosome segregation ATPase
MSDFYDKDLKESGDDVDEAAQEVVDLAQQREKVLHEVNATNEEMERLRMRQEQLENERRNLEAIEKAGQEYRQHKQQLVESLEASLVTLDKHAAQTKRYLDCQQSNQKRYRDMLGEIRAIDDESWKPGEVREHIARSRAVLNDAQKEFDHGQARLQSMTPDYSEPGASEQESSDLKSIMGAGFYFKVALAASVPCVLIVLLVLFVLHHFPGILFPLQPVSGG